MNNFFDEVTKRLKANPAQVSDLMLAVEGAFDQFGYREEISAPVENILVVRLDAIGDMILTSGFLRELRKNFPQAHITFVVSPLVYPIVEMCPYVNEVLVFDRKKLANNFPEQFAQLIAFCRENLWSKKFSIAFSPQWGSQNLQGLLLCWLSGARERIGFGTNPYKNYGFEPSAEESAIDNFLLTKNIFTQQSEVAEIEKMFYLLKAVGLKVNQTHTELFFGATDFIRARELLQNISPNCKKVIVGIGAGIDSRKYPVEKYLVALNELAKKNLTFIIVGDKSDINDATYLEQNLPRGKVLNLVCKTTLSETEAVISQSDFYIGNDSGVMHMAATAKLPCIVLYRDAQDKEDILPGVFAESQRFTPWQTNAVILRPDNQLEDCARRSPIYGWCHHKEPHCITQIRIQEIIAGFEVLEGMT